MTTETNQAKFNTVLFNSFNGMVTFESDNKDQDWDKAIDAVDYPVNIHSAGYQKDGEWVNGNYNTNTGRDSQYQMVVADMYRDGNFNPIGIVSDTYGSVITASVYEELKEQLDSIDGLEYNLQSLFVTGNGGSQTLNIRMNDILDTSNLPDKISLVISFASSVDGSKSHSINLLAHNHDTNSTFDFGGSIQRLSARHTTSLKQRSIDFIPSILKLVKNWNTEIVPFMMLMCDSKFDRNMALDLVEAIGEEADLGKRHVSKIVSLYGTGQVRTNDKSNSLYRINSVISEYIEDEMAQKPELQQRSRKALGKAMSKAVKKYSSK